MLTLNIKQICSISYFPSISFFSYFFLEQRQSFKHFIRISISFIKFIHLLLNIACRLAINERVCVNVDEKDQKFVNKQA